MQHELRMGLEARQQRLGAIAQTALVGRHGLHLRLGLGIFGFPGRLIGKQTGQVPLILYIHLTALWQTLFPLGHRLPPLSACFGRNRGLFRRFRRHA